MWFCFFPLLSKATQEPYCYSSNKQPGKQTSLTDVDEIERAATVLLPKVPPEGHGAARWWQKEQKPHSPSEQEAKQCPLLAPAAEENSYLRRELVLCLVFFSPGLAVIGLASNRMLISSRDTGMSFSATLLSPGASPGLSERP